MNPDTTPTPRTDAIQFQPKPISLSIENEMLRALSRKLEREFAEKTNEVARLRASLELYANMIIQRYDELIRLLEENAALKKEKVFVDPKWIYNLETQLAKAHEELCQAGLREYGN